MTPTGYRIAEIRCSVPAENVAGYFEKTPGHWIIDSVIANPMSGYPEYKARRSSWGSKANGTVIVELVTESGLIGIGLSQGGVPAARIIIDHLSRFLLGSDPRDTEVDEWDAISFQTAGGSAGTIASTGSVGRGSSTVEGHTIFGTRGHVTIDIRVGQIDMVFYDGRTFIEPPLEPYERYPLQATSRQLVDTFLGRSPAVASGELGAQTVEFLDAARRSAQSGKIVRI
jgi:hypothetical protein